MPNESFGEKLFGKPLSRISQDEAEVIMAGITSLLGEESLLLDAGVEKGQVPCMWCPTIVFSNVGLASHLGRHHPEVVTAMTNDINKGKPAMEHAVRMRASNRQVISQMEKWGWVRGKTRQSEIQMLLDRPDEKRVEAWVRREHIDTSNPHAIWAYIYEVTKVTPDEFWKGPAPVIDLRRAPEATSEMLAKQAAGRAKNISTRVLELLLAQDTVLTTAFIGETLGFTEMETARACSYLTGKGLAKNVKRGMWAAVNQHHHQTTEGIEITVSEQQDVQPPAEPAVPTSESVAASVPPPAPVAKPTPPADLRPLSPDPSTEEVLALLDMISPKGFKAADLPAVMAWVESTQALMRRLD